MEDRGEGERGERGGEEGATKERGRGEEQKREEEGGKEEEGGVGGQVAGVGDVAVEKEKDEEEKEEYVKEKEVEPEAFRVRPGTQIYTPH